MRKKWIAILTVIVFALSLTACSGTGNPGSASSLPPVQSSDQSSDQSSKQISSLESEEPAMSANANIEAGKPDTSPIVYMTTDISSDGLMAIYEALGATPNGNVAVKVHTGEGENSNHLRPELIKALVQSLDATIVECNTAYGGSRANTAYHKQLAADHGFTAIANVDIMDEDGDMPIPVSGGTHLQENYVGTHFADYDYYVVLSHFKGHLMGGFGGAVKNVSIGIASSKGKSWIHSAGTETTGFGMGTEQDKFLESMAEAAKSVTDYMNGNMLYINVMNRLSVDCDCNAKPAEPDIHDIGILASLDPVALDQACVDLVYAAPDGASLIGRMESRNGIHTLEHGETIGLGSRTYELVSIQGAQPAPIPNGNDSKDNNSINLNVNTGGFVFPVKLYDNDTTKALLELLPMTLNMSELNGNEKYYYLPKRLPTSDVQVDNIRAGELMLFGSDCLVLFYKDFPTSYSYTKLGYIEDASGLADALGQGNVDVVFSISE